MAYTTIDDPSAYFQTKTYTGTGSSHAVTLDGNSNLQPDWVWIKARSQARNHKLYDSVRGVTKTIGSNETDAEATVATSLTAFGSNGFTVSSDVSVNESSETFVAWNWLAGGSASSNTDGSITSTVSANQTAGFSIVSFTGNGSAGATVGHGLASVPKFIVVKTRSTAANWITYNAYNGNTDYMYFNQTGATAATVQAWNNTSPTSSVFSLGNSSEVNGSGTTMIAYCFSEIKGYSKVGGSYTGNGNADGTFVYTGFKPAFIIAKRSDGANNWIMHDNKRPEYNPTNILFPNLSNVELSSNNQFDILSNGFKCRASTSDSNTSGGSYIFLAFAESSFVSSSGIPTTAR